MTDVSSIFPLKLKALLALALVASLVSGCGRVDEPKLLASAREYLSKEDNVSAAIQLKTLLQANPSSAEGRLLLGRALLGSGDPAAAEIELRRARELGQPDELVAPPLSLAMLSQRRYTEVIETFGPVVLQDDLAAADLKTHLALAFVETRDLARAQSALSAAIKRSPRHPGALVLKARIAADRGERDQAMEIADALLARSPDHPQAWMLKGDLLLQGPPSDPVGAQTAFRKALSLRRDLLPAHRAVVSLLMRQGDLPAAKQQLEEMKKVLPRAPQTLLLDAALAYLSGDANRTREVTQQLLRVAPDDAPTLLLAGQAEIQLNNLFQAQALLNKAVQVVPNAPAPRQYLALAYLRHGQADRALATLQPMVDAVPPDATALKLSGQAHLLRGDFKNASASFDRAMKLAPGDPTLRTARAVSMLARGLDDQGLAELQGVIDADAKGTSADLALVSARVARKEFNAASKALDGLAQKIPDQPLPDHLRGRIAAMQADTAGARKSYESALAKDPRYLPSVIAIAELDLSEGKADAARRRFEAVLQHDPRSAMAMIALAELARRAGGRPDEVVSWMEKAIKTAPMDAGIHKAVIDIYLRGGDGRAAQSAAQAAVAALPNEPELLQRLGDAQMMVGEASQAVVTFRKLAGLRPESSLVQLQLAEALRANGDAVAADRHVRQALEMSPKSLQAQQAGAALAVREKRFDRALELARAIQGQYPAEAIGFRMEGDIEAGQKHWDAAIAAFRRAVGKNNPGDAPARLHWSLLNGKWTAEAAQFEKEWSRGHPNDRAFMQHLAEMAMLRSDWPAAEAGFRKLLELQPDNVSALNNLAYLLAKANKPGALALAEQAVKLSPRQPEVLDTLAMVYATEKQLDKAIQWQLKAVELAPRSGGLRLNLAKLYLRAGDKTKARVELDTLAELGKRFSEYAEVDKLRRELGT